MQAAEQNGVGQPTLDSGSKSTRYVVIINNLFESAADENAIKQTLEISYNLYPISVEQRNKRVTVKFKTEEEAKTLVDERFWYRSLDYDTQYQGTIEETAFENRYAVKGLPEKMLKKPFMSVVAKLDVTFGIDASELEVIDDDLIFTVTDANQVGKIADKLKQENGFQLEISECNYSVVEF
jgi:hypothetical protein